MPSRLLIIFKRFPLQSISFIKKIIPMNVVRNWKVLRMEYSLKFYQIFKLKPFSVIHSERCQTWSVLPTELTASDGDQIPACSVTFTEEVLNGKLHFLCSGCFTGFWVRLWLLFVIVRSPLTLSWRGPYISWFLCDKDLRHEKVKDPLFNPRQFLAAESPFKMIRNAFYFM